MYSLQKQPHNLEARRQVPASCMTSALVYLQLTMWQNDLPQSGSTLNQLQLNSNKCKELRITFAKQEPAFEPIVVNGNKAQSFSVLQYQMIYHGMGISIRYLRRLPNETIIYFLVQLKRAKHSSSDLVYVLFYSKLRGTSVPLRPSKVEASSCYCLPQ